MITRQTSKIRGPGERHCVGRHVLAKDGAAVHHRGRRVVGAGRAHGALGLPHLVGVGAAGASIAHQASVALDAQALIDAGGV